MRRVRIIDSNTGGEPTRVVLEGGPDLGTGSLSERLRRFEGEHDAFRSAIVNEPRGSDVLVGALLLPPVDPGCAAGVLFFNNVGSLGMCGHGTIGLVVTLAHLGRLSPGAHRVETPVGDVQAELHPDGRVTVTNVPSYRHAADVSVSVPGVGEVRGDVAWGGNWFFLVHSPTQPLAPGRTGELTAFASAVRKALRAAGITGAAGAEIDHVELYGPSAQADSQNFVLCPGDAYDRSPCGTGTSAKVACLAAEGKLRPGETFRQESIVGSLFEASYSLDPGTPGAVIPRITGSAFVTGEGTLLLDQRDPFCWGIPHAR